MKIVQEHEISENSISQEEGVGLGLSSTFMICKNVLGGSHGLQLGFALKTWILWKTAKWYELCETLGLSWIGLWDVCVYATALIIDLCVHLVEAFKLVWIALSYNLGNDKTILPPSHIKWHSWHCHIYQCIILILNNFINLLEKIIKIWYFENIHWDEFNDILYDIIYHFLLVEKYGQSMLGQ